MRRVVGLVMMLSLTWASVAGAQDQAQGEDCDCEKVVGQQAHSERNHVIDLFVLKRSGNRRNVWTVDDKKFVVFACVHPKKHEVPAHTLSWRNVHNDTTIVVRFRPGEWPFVGPPTDITIAPKGTSEARRLRKNLPVGSYHHYDHSYWKVGNTASKVHDKKDPQGPAVVSDD